jgi:hypothetical protein
MYATAPTGGLWKTNTGGQQWAARSAGWPIQSATAVAVDPNHPNRVFVGTGDYKRLDHVEPFSVGVMRSLDAGLTWSQFGTAEMRDFTVSRIVVDPSNSNHVLAATGRGSRLPGGQIFGSTDAGVTWTSVGPEDANWDDLKVCDVATPNHVFWAAATRRQNLDDDDANSKSGRLYLSPDGVSWAPVSLTTSTSTSTFNLDTVTPDVIKIACGHAGLLGDLVVFVAVYLGGGVRVFATSSQGLEWIEVTSTPVLGVGAAPWARAAFEMTRNRLFVGGVFLFAADLGSLDFLVPLFVQGTLTFTSASSASSASCTNGGFTHSDFQCVVPDPTETDAVFLCTDGGLYHFSPDSKITTSLSATLGVAQIYHMDVHPRNGGLIAISAQDLGTSVNFFGNPGGWANVLGCDAGGVAFKGDGSSLVYLTDSCGEVARFDESAGPVASGVCSDSIPPQTGLTLLQTGAAPDSAAPLLYRASLNLLDYADTRFREFGNPDVAAGPIAPHDSPVLSPANIQSLAACPTDPTFLYAGSQIGELFYSDNGGTMWHPVVRNGKPLIPPSNAPIWAISPSPTIGHCHDVLIAVGYEDTIFPALPCTSFPGSIRSGCNVFLPGDRLFRKTDVTDGSLWSQVHGDGGTQPLPHAPIFAVARRPSAPDKTWFVASDVGVFRTDNGGTTWANMTAPLGLPNTLVRDLRLSADGNTLYAGTFGRGVWSMDVARPANAFGVRGLVTVASAPIKNASVTASGPGRIKKWLKNTLTAGPIVPTAPVTTAPIEVTAAAATTISQATVSLIVSNAEAVSLLPPSGAALPMSGTPISGSVSEFQLTAASAAALVGRGTTGQWRFSVTGNPIIFNNKVIGRLIPAVQSGSVDFQFTEAVHTFTGADGEYTIEYLSQGAHTVSAGFNGATQLLTVTLNANRTDVNFARSPVGVFTLEPKRAQVDVDKPVTYALTYTITNGQSWRNLATVQLRFRDDEGSILWLEFDTAQETFSLVNPKNGALGPAFAPGQPNRLETSAATVYLANMTVEPNVPDPSSVTLTLPVSFKPQAKARIYAVEVIATNQLGESQGPDLAARLQVGDIP